MRLIFLHGAPATGKLTVARSILSLLPGRRLENHAAIDFAKNMFDFAAPGFWELVHAIRVSALEAAWQHGVPLVVATFCYCHPEDRPLFKQFEAIVNRSRGQCCPFSSIALRKNGASDRQCRSRGAAEAHVHGRLKSIPCQLPGFPYTTRRLHQPGHNRNPSRCHGTGNHSTICARWLGGWY